MFTASDIEVQKGDKQSQESITKIQVLLREHHSLPRAHSTPNYIITNSFELKQSQGSPRLACKSSAEKKQLISLDRGAERPVQVIPHTDSFQRWKNFERARTIEAITNTPNVILAGSLTLAHIQCQHLNYSEYMTCFIYITL